MPRYQYHVCPCDCASCRARQPTTLLPSLKLTSLIPSTKTFSFDSVDPESNMVYIYLPTGIYSLLTRFSFVLLVGATCPFPYRLSSHYAHEGRQRNPCHQRNPCR